MRAEDTLQYLFDFYGRIFPTRRHALNQLFCVIGNGYDWIDGQLAYYDASDYHSRWELKEPIERAIEPVGEIPSWMKFEWYPLCEYSKINNIPNNITDDWLALANECKALLAEDGIIV